LNYIPRRAVSALGTLRFSISPASSNLIVVPQWTVCKTSTGVKFLTSTDSVILAGSTYVDVTGIQGELVTISYTSSGSTAQEYSISDTAVENSNVIVTINGVIWTKVTSFINATTTSTEYIIRPELDDTITIVFGDNVYGKAPALGDTIIIKYVKSSGTSGNVYTNGTITTVDSAIYDSTGALTTVSVTNTTSFLGGEDIETTEEIRYNAPRVFSTGDRLVTKEDFIAVLDDYAGVATSNAWGENEETNPDVDNYNRVKISILLSNWELMSSEFETELTEYLYTKSMMTVRYTFIDPEIVYIIPTLSVYVLKGFSLSAVQADISNALDTQFTLGTTAKLGTSIRLSDVYAGVRDVSGVSYCIVTLKSYKELVKNYDSTYNYGETLDLLPVLAGTVDVYVNDTLVATDNGSGTFVDSSSIYVVSGVVNYITGVVGIDVSSVLTTDVISVIYRQNEDGDIVVTNSQIPKLYTIDYDNLSFVS